MADNKQTQKAGDNAQQIQAGTVIINNGINETQARELYSEMSIKAMQEYTSESKKLIETRIAQFENVLIPRMEKLENAFQAFAEPEFLLELKKAQVASACTDRESDYELLSKLLLHRIENNDNRRVKASVSKAVETVEKIDDESLCGLTIIYAILVLYPRGSTIHKSLETLNNLLGALCYHKLPYDDEWVSYLDILDVLRISHIVPLAKLSDYYYHELNGYTECGFKIGSDEYNKALEILREVDIEKNILVSHDFLDNYVRLPISRKGDYESLCIGREDPKTKVVAPTPLSDVEKQALDKIWNLYSQNEFKKREIQNRFDELWNSYDNLVKISNWWKSIPYNIEITPIGKVIAQANAQKYYENLPIIRY